MFSHLWFVFSIRNIVKRSQDQSHHPSSPWISQPVHSVNLQQQQRPQSGRNSFTLDPSEDNISLKDPSEDNSFIKKTLETKSTTNPGYVKHTHTYLDQIGSLEFVWCVLKQTQCVCVTVSVRAPAQLRAGMTQAHL